MERAAQVSELSSDILLAILLKTGAPGCDVLELSRRLLAVFGGVKPLLSSDWRSLEARLKASSRRGCERPLRGIGHVKCLELSAAFELGRRAARLTPEEQCRRCVKTPADAYELFRGVLSAGMAQEVFHVIPLDTRRHPLCEPICVARGTRDALAVHVRDVFREAVRWNARSVLVAHTHPTGDPTPSAADFKMTEHLVEVSKVIGIELADHLVLGGQGMKPPYVSLRMAKSW